MSREIYIGEVLTLLHDRPVKFVARAFDGSETEEPLDQTPLKYVFNEQGVEEGVKADFTMKVSKALVMRHDGMITHHTHNTAIRFAIVSKRLSPGDSEFLLTTEGLKSQETTQTMSPETLKMEILRFFYTFNKPWPEQGISPWHLLDHFYATQEQVQQWIRFWRKAGFLLQQSSGVRYRENRGQVRSVPDTINPAKFDDVEEAVNSFHSMLMGVTNDSETVRAFISYSHEDGMLAGEIKKYLEKHGISAFLAHVDIEVSKEWEDIIRKELHECDIFVPLLTDNFRPSKWTDQEAGFAVGLNKTVFPLMVRDIPHGFLERIMAFKLDIDNVAPACEEIIAVIRKDEKLGPLLAKAVSQSS